MDVASLEAALPAEAVTALTLITSTDNAYVAEEQRAAGVLSPQAWFRRVSDLIPESGGIGEAGWGHPYILRVEKNAASDSELLVASQQIRQYFGGSKNPHSITGHVWTSVESCNIDIHPGSPELRAVEATIVFHGREISTTT